MRTFKERPNDTGELIALSTFEYNAVVRQLATMAAIEKFKAAFRAAHPGDAVPRTFAAWREEFDTLKETK